jgi:DNA-binding CsgD family transcriptional regulator
MADPGPDRPDRDTDTGQELADVIGLVYEAAVFPERWPEALRAIRDLVGASSGMFSLSYLASGRGEVLAADGLDPSVLSAWEQRHGMSPWVRGSLSFPVGAVNAGHMHIPLEELRETSLYRELLEPLGILDIVGVLTARTPLLLGAVSFYDGQLFGPRALRRLEALAPHLVRATALRNRVAWLSERAAAFETGVERLPVGLILIGAEGDLLHMNAHARVAVETRDGLRIDQGRLLLVDREARRGFEEALDRVRRTGVASGPILVPRPSGARPFQLVVSPSSSRGDSPGERAALVWIHDPEEVAVPSHDALEQLFGLSPAEARMAASLAAGATVRTYAAEAGVTEGTARIRLKQVLAKTGAARQADLVRIVLSSLPGLL